MPSFTAIVLTSLLAVSISTTDAYQEPPKGLQFLGVGYNILEGNPDGGDLSRGGIDPGLLFTRKVFELSYDNNKVTIDRQYLIPDQVSFAPRSSCVTTTKNEVFSGSKSYTDKLKVDVAVDGKFKVPELWKAAFTLSASYKKTNKETSTYENVFYEEKKVCNRGRARYQLDLAPRKQFPVSEDFAAAVCALPERYDERSYFNFVERWGTHIVVEVELGEKTIERTKSSKAEFTKHAILKMKGAVSLSGGFKGFKSSLKVDMSKVRDQMTQESKFGEHKIVLTSGGMDMPEPIGLKLVSVDEALNIHFYAAADSRAMSPCQHTESLLRSRKYHLQKIFKEYPRLKGVKEEPVDPEIVIPLTWPKGTYGLPMTTRGCPKSSGFNWNTGYRYHENEIGNEWSVPYHLAGKKSIWTNTQSFCIKTKEQGTEYDLAWAPGQYCLFKKGNCPEGETAHLPLSEPNMLPETISFEKGYIRWDDENSDNDNDFRGTMPDGKFTDNTLLYYCCRTDGYATNPIMLPTDTPFVLFKSNSHECQEVEGMHVREEFFKWDTEDWSFSGNKKGGSVPYGEVGKNIRLDYCYYSSY